MVALKKEGLGPDPTSYRDIKIYNFYQAVELLVINEVQTKQWI